MCFKFQIFPLRGLRIFEKFRIWYTQLKLFCINSAAKLIAAYLLLKL